MKTPGVGDRPQDERRVGSPTFDGKLFRSRRFAQVHMVPVNEELSQPRQRETTQKGGAIGWRPIAGGVRKNREPKTFPQIRAVRIRTRTATHHSDRQRAQARKPRLPGHAGMPSPIKPRHMAARATGSAALWFTFDKPSHATLK